MRARARRRSFSSSLLRVLVPRVTVFAVGATILGLGHAIALESSASSSPGALEPRVDAAPVWTSSDAASHPECVPSSAWPTGVPADHVVVHSFRHDVHLKMAFDRAWVLNHDATEVDDVWVIGVCGPRNS